MLSRERGTGGASVIKNKGTWFCSAVDQLAREQIAQILTNIDSGPMVYHIDKPV